MDHRPARAIHRPRHPTALPLQTIRPAHPCSLQTKPVLALVCHQHHRSILPALHHGPLRVLAVKMLQLRQSTPRPHPHTHQLAPRFLRDLPREIEKRTSSIMYQQRIKKDSASGIWSLAIFSCFSLVFRLAFEPLLFTGVWGKHCAPLKQRRVTLRYLGYSQPQNCTKAASKMNSACAMGRWGWRRMWFHRCPNRDVFMKTYSIT